MILMGKSTISMETSIAISIGFPVPSGKLTVCYGKSPFFMGKLTTNGHFQ